MLVRSTTKVCTAKTSKQNIFLNQYKKKQVQTRTHLDASQATKWNQLCPIHAFWSRADPEPVWLCVCVCGCRRKDFAREKNPLPTTGDSLFFFSCPPCIPTPWCSVRCTFDIQQLCFNQSAARKNPPKIHLSLSLSLFLPPPPHQTPKLKKTNPSAHPTKPLRRGAFILLFPTTPPLPPTPVVSAGTACGCASVCVDWVIVSLLRPFHRRFPLPARVLTLLFSAGPVFFFFFFLAPFSLIQFFIGVLFFISFSSLFFTLCPLPFYCLFDI